VLRRPYTYQYNQSRIGDQAIFNSWKNNLKKKLKCTLQTSHINEIDKNKLELFRNNICNIVYSKSPVYNNINGPGVDIKGPCFT
jgi:hypothetical protein